MGYKGKITTVGNSDAIRLDKALFKQHPEFEQQAEVNAHVIGTGVMLISVEQPNIADDYDPFVDAFLSFIQADMVKNMNSLTQLDQTTIEHAQALVNDVVYTDDDFE